jgi:hypothetical protein
MGKVKAALRHSASFDGGWAPERAKEEGKEEVEPQSNPCILQRG